MPKQRYISGDLSHFVGRGKSDEEQYDILVNKILKKGWITHGPTHNPCAHRGLSINLSEPISADKMLQYQVVCFCDIPEADIAIHVSKYSKFGLSFKKKYLVELGACPVFYIAKEGPVPVDRLFCPDDFMQRINDAKSKSLPDRALYFDTTIRALMDIMIALDAITSTTEHMIFKGCNADEFKSRFAALLGLDASLVSAFEDALKGSPMAGDRIRVIIDFIVNYVLTYFKFFSANTSDDDEHNYYMEREWRVASNVSFQLTDVVRVFFPQKYAARFREDVPEYIGQISFVDNDR